MSDDALTGPAPRLEEELHAIHHMAGLARHQHVLIWVRGADSISFLDALLSRSIASAEPGTVLPSLLLTPQGKMRALVWVLRGGDDAVGLVTQATTAEIVVSDLERFRFRVDAAIEADPRPVATLVGAGAEEALAIAAVGAPSPSTWVEGPNGLVAAIPFREGSRFVVAGPAVDDVAGDTIALSDDAYSAFRIEQGEPLGGVDFDDSTIAHELGPVDALVDFDKGCYLGQELIARIDSRGRVTRRLRLLEASTDQDLAGAELLLAGKAVGHITSSVPIANGRSIGLGIVRHEVDGGTTVQASLEDSTVDVKVGDIGTSR